MDEGPTGEPSMRIKITTNSRLGGQYCLWCLLYVLDIEEGMVSHAYTDLAIAR